MQVEVIRVSRSHGETKPSQPNKKLKEHTITKRIDPRCNSIKSTANKLVIKAVGQCRYLVAKCKNWCMQQFGTSSNDEDQRKFWERDQNDAKLWAEVEQEVMHNTLTFEGIQYDDTKQIWIGQPTVAEMQRQTESLVTKTQKLKGHFKKESADSRKEQLAKGGKAFYKFLKQDYRNAATVIEDEDGKPTSYLPDIHRIFKKTWEEVYNTHKLSKPQFDEFKKKYEQFFPTDAVFRVMGGACD